MKFLTHSLIDSYTALTDKEQCQLRGFMLAFNGCTVEWLSTDEAAKRHAKSFQIFQLQPSTKKKAQTAKSAFFLNNKEHDDDKYLTTN